MNTTKQPSIEHRWFVTHSRVAYLVAAVFAAIAAWMSSRAGSAPTNAEQFLMLVTALIALAALLVAIAFALHKEKR
jgi:high-affinity Fe2+/Pb2+ permease